MSEQERNARIVEGGFAAFNERDVARMQAMFAPDCEVHVAPPLVNSGTWNGPDGFADMVTGWNEAFATQTNTVLAMHHPNERHVVAEVHQGAVGAGSGVPVEMDIVYLFEIRDGMVARLHIYAELAAAHAAVRD